MQEDIQIERIRKTWRQKLIILGHHYQRSSVLQHADVVGDSLELARQAAASTEALRIVLCGVKFMAETADALTREDQVVYMPDTSAGCPMANMADASQMMKAWQTLQTAGNDWLPVVYVNSSAEVKACCGKLGGSACTSSNAQKVIEWVFSQGKRVFFLPDEHLGRNTAYVMDIPDDQVVVYDPKLEGGGLTIETLAKARIVVWKGFCLVHTAFQASHVEEVRRLYPEAKIIVHPETPNEVLRLCDVYGSTSQIIGYVQSLPEGSTVVIGTENNLVERLALQYQGKLTIKALAPSVCANMSKTNEVNLLNLLNKWSGSNQVCVDEQIVGDVKKCIDRMLNL